MLKYPPRVDVISEKQCQNNFSGCLETIFQPFFEKIEKPTVPQPLDLNVSLYYHILIPQKDNQLRRNSGEVQNLKKNNVVQGNPKGAQFIRPLAEITEFT